MSADKLIRTQTTPQSVTLDKPDTAFVATVDAARDAFRPVRADTFTGSEYRDSIYGAPASDGRPNRWVGRVAARVSRDFVGPHGDKRLSQTLTLQGRKGPVTAEAVIDDTRGGESKTTLTLGRTSVGQRPRVAVEIRRDEQGQSIGPAVLQLRFGERRGRIELSPLATRAVKSLAKLALAR
jgi:hypothetical protein